MAKTSIQGGNYTGASYDPQANASDAIREWASCWYIRASRSEVSVQTQVGQSGAYGPWGQPLEPSGSNIISFLLERWTDQDPKWPMAQEWLKKLDPELAILKSPLKGNIASLVTTNRFSKVDVEPEVHLHKDSQEVLANLFNHAVNTMNKQVIFSTHSWDMLLPYISDVAKDMRKRGAGSVAIDPSKFTVQEFTRKEGKISIQEYPLREHGFKDAAGHFGQLLG